MLDLYTKEKRAASARRRREEMRRHIDLLKERQQIEHDEDQRRIMRILYPLVKVTRTEEFRAWYRNQREIDWNPNNEKNEHDFLGNLAFAGFAGLSDIDMDMDGYAAELEKTIRRKVEVSIALWRVRLERVRQATPPWFDKAKIKALERKRAHFNQLLPDAAPWHIDHIVPLAGETVCGLHVHTNMRIIPRSLNAMKHNFFDDELLDVSETIV